MKRNQLSRLHSLLVMFAAIISSSSAAPPASSSSSSSSSSASAVEAPADEKEIKFIDPTEKFHHPPPTRIPIGELLDEAEIIAVVFSTEHVKIEDCEGLVLRLKRICAVRVNWMDFGPPSPRIVRNSWGDEFLLAVNRHYREYFAEPVDPDAFFGPFFCPEVPHLYFGKSRPVTRQQAQKLRENLDTSTLDGKLGSPAMERIPLDFEINHRTPVRAVQGSRGAYPLFSLEKIAAMLDPDQFPIADISASDFKYLNQTYGVPDTAPLVRALNRLLAVLSKEEPEARQALETLKTDPDTSVAEAATYLLTREKLPKFEFRQPIPLPVGN